MPEISFFELLEKTCLYFAFQRKSRSNKLLIFFNCVQILQIFAIFIPEDETSGVPWAYYYISNFWDILKALSNPVLLLRLMGVNLYSSIMVNFVLLCSNLLCYFKVALWIKNLDRFEFRDLSSEDDHSWVIKLKNFSRVQTSSFLLIPLLYSLFGHLKAITEGKTLFPVYLELALFLVTFVVYLPTVLWEEILLRNLKWNDHNADSVADHRTLAIKYVIIIILVFQEAFLPYKDYLYEKLVLYLVLGIVFLYTFLVRRPFHAFPLNYLESLKGLLLVVISLVILAARAALITDKSFFPPITVLLTFSVLSIGVFITLRELENKFPSSVSSLYKVEHSIRYVLKHNSNHSELDQLLKEALEKFYDHIIFIWVINYLLSSPQDKDYIKFLLNQLMKRPKSLLMLSQVNRCQLDVEASLANNEQEAESIGYVSTQEQLEEVLEKDRLVCFDLASLMEAKEKNLLSFNAFVDKLLKVEASIEGCKNSYERIVKKSTSKTHPTVFKYYLGFLQSIVNSEHFENINLQMKQAKDTLNARRKNIHDVLFCDSKNFLVKVSLEKENFGKIIYVRNSEILGYSENSLLMKDFKVLIPQPTKRHHDHWSKKIARYRHRHSFYFGVHSLVVLTSQSFLVTIDLKARIILDSSNSLSIMLAAKPNNKHIDFAMFDYEKNYEVTGLTEGFSRFLKQEIGLSHQFVNLFKEFKVSKEAEVGLELTQATTCLGEIMSIRVDTFYIFNLYPLKVLGLFRWTGEDWVRSSYISNPNAKRREGTSLYQEKQLKRNMYESIVSVTISHSENKGSLTLNNTYHTKGLDSETKAKVKKSKNEYRSLISSLNKKTATASILMLAIIIVSFVQSIICYSVLKNDVKGLEADLGNMKGTSRRLLAESADFSRDLQLISGGYEWSNTSEEVVQDLNKISADLKEASNHFYEQASEINSESFTQRVNEPQFYWVGFQDGDFFEEFVTLSDLFGKVSRNIQNLNGLKRIYRNSTEFINLYTNCPKQALKQVNNTIKPYIEIRNQISKKKIESSIYFVLPAASFVLVVSMVVIGYFIYRIERLRKGVWSQIESIPGSKFAEKKKLASERLSVIHDFHEFSESKYKAEKEFKYRMHPTMKRLALVFVFMCCLETAYISSFYYQFYYEIKDRVLQLPYKVENVGVLLTDLELTSFWVREVALQDSDQHYSNLVRTKKFAVSPLSEAKHHIESLKYWKTHLLDLQFLETENQEVFTMMFESACSECLNHMKKGLYYSLLEYEKLIESMLAEIENGLRYQSMYQEFFFIQKFQKEIISALDTYVDKYTKKTFENIEEVFQLVVLCVSTYSLFQLVFLFTVMNISLFKAKQLIKNEIEFIELFSVDKETLYSSIAKDYT